MNPVIQTAQHFPNALPIFNALPVMGKLHNVRISCVFEEARESESLTMGRTAREAGGDKTREPELASLIVVNDELANAPVIVNATRPPSDNTEDELPANRGVPDPRGAANLGRAHGISPEAKNLVNIDGRHHFTRPAGARRLDVRQGCQSPAAQLPSTSPAAGTPFGSPASPPPCPRGMMARSLGKKRAAPEDEEDEGGEPVVSRHW
ncbi:hypothetical protein DB88DRAFT_87076 [Papiliotrema laurentii]|uniref:Uncharacterized protein n=1 Tax=Papiliotrema laurentii TaxID=5418 RepID=A0AAD9CTB5_PAPLA|nr:hypothetical protein DB88DRAFT_87076 [Papiliotrema laurentii]